MLTPEKVHLTVRISTVFLYYKPYWHRLKQNGWNFKIAKVKKKKKKEKHISLYWSLHCVRVEQVIVGQ